MGASISSTTTKSASETNDFELVITAYKELEHALEQEFNAKGKTLNDKILWVASNHSEFSPGLVRNMRDLVTIRDKLIHERGYQSIPERALFLQRYERSREEFKTMVQYQRVNQQRQVNNNGATSPTSVSGKWGLCCHGI